MMSDPNKIRLMGLWTDFNLGCFYKGSGTILHTEQEFPFTQPVKYQCAAYTSSGGGSTDDSKWTLGTKTLELPGQGGQTKLVIGLPQAFFMFDHSWHRGSMAFKRGIMQPCAYGVWRLYLYRTPQPLFHIEDGSYVLLYINWIPPSPLESHLSLARTYPPLSPKRWNSKTW